MTDDFASLYAYNRWADRRVLEACRKLTPEQYAAEPLPGWTSVRSSIVHIAIVTEGWLRGVASGSGGGAGWGGGGGGKTTQGGRRCPLLSLPPPTPPPP